MQRERRVAALVAGLVSAQVWIVASCGGRTDLGLTPDGGSHDGTTSGSSSGADSGPESGSETGSESGPDGSVCSDPGCAPGTLRSCNTYGTQSCNGSCDWGVCSCASAPVCVPDATQCSGNGVQTCDPCGQWGGTVRCAAATPLCSKGACASPPSCQAGGAGMTDCGSNSAGESCCTSPEIPGGTFYRTYPPGDGVSSDGNPASVSGFRLDDYLVTVGRFRQFVSAVLPADGGSGWLPPSGSGKHSHLSGGHGLVDVGSAAVDAGLVYETGWVASDDSNVAPTTANLTTTTCMNAGTWTGSPGSQENVPINCLNWYEAYAFCIWDGGFLPSEAEWVYAAAGGSQQRAYPWGSMDPGTSNQYAIYGSYYMNSGSFSMGGVAPVGSAPLGVGAWGQLDLAGDVWEWTLDWYAPFVDPCTDCANLSGGTFRINRGGDWNDITDRLVVPNREGWDYPWLRYLYYGFRCARAP